MRLSVLTTGLVALCFMATSSVSAISLTMVPDTPSGSNLNVGDMVNIDVMVNLGGVDLDTLIAGITFPVANFGAPSMVNEESSTPGVGDLGLLSGPGFVDIAFDTLFTNDGPIVDDGPLYSFKLTAMSPGENIDVVFNPGSLFAVDTNFNTYSNDTFDGDFDTNALRYTINRQDGSDIPEPATATLALMAAGFLRVRSGRRAA